MYVYYVKGQILYQNVDNKSLWKNYIIRVIRPIKTVMIALGSTMIETKVTQEPGLFCCNVLINTQQKCLGVPGHSGTRVSLPPYKQARTSKSTSSSGLVNSS